MNEHDNNIGQKGEAPMMSSLVMHVIVHGIEAITSNGDVHTKLNEDVLIST
jgi:hypothetical protein